MFWLFSACEDVDQRVIPDEATPAFAISGDYLVQDQCGGLAEFRMRIEPFESKADEIILHNFMGRQFVAHASYNGDGFTIPKHVFRTELETIYVEGHVYDTPTEGLAMIYDMQSGHDDYQCTAKCAKTVAREN
jgi:hypothetical protein